MKTVKIDLLIIGGGIAGLWLLNRAIKAGLNAVLFEKATLGGGQTIRSQGIIHGGTKYALNGVLTQASNTIKEMPQRWRDCLQGQGELDLSDVKVLSDAHYMWSKGSLGSRMTTFFATKAFRGRIAEVTKDDRPAVFKDKAFKGSLYRLSELVLNVPTLIDALRKPVDQYIFQADILAAAADVSGGYIRSFTFPEQKIRIEPAQVVITSGEGFEALAEKLSIKQPEMQRRPLHMVMVKHDLQLPAYAHCIGTGSKPVATITTHPCEDGKQIWYLGGDVAETGVDRSREEQIKFARKAMSELLPWVDLDNAQWQTFHVDRAEPMQSSLVRPDSAFAQQVGNCIVAWPTKLALSPDLSDQVLPLCQKHESTTDLSVLNAFPKPETAKPLWETMF